MSVTTRRRTTTKQAGPISLRAFARGFGVSHQAVMRACRSGRLKRSLVKIDGVDKIADPELAGKEWAANTDLSRAPDRVKAQAALRTTKTGSATPTRPESDTPQGAQPDASPPAEDGKAAETLAGASAREKHWRAQTAELRYRQAAGELVSAAEVQGRLVDVFTTCRTKLLGIPSKVKQQRPEVDHELLAVIDAAVREALEELAPPAEKGAAAKGAAA